MEIKPLEWSKEELEEQKQFVLPPLDADLKSSEDFKAQYGVWPYPEDPCH